MAEEKFMENAINNVRHVNTLWYEDPSILLKNVYQYFPTNNLTETEKINAMARLAIYYSIIIIGVGADAKWLSVSVIIILISIFLGRTDLCSNSSILTDGMKNKFCQHPTDNNPFMNYTLADQITKPDRASACLYQDVKQEIRNKFKSKMHADSRDIWGRDTTERNFYTMPNTRNINAQTEFAKWCFNIYEAGATCKENGENCLIAIDPRYQNGRVVTSSLDINGNPLYNSVDQSE